MERQANLDELVGKVFTDVSTADNDALYFQNAESVYKLYHAQDCCESVTIEDICGDLTDLIGTPIMVADQVSNLSDEEIDVLTDHYHGADHSYEAYQWSFYRFRTIKGTVTVRFYGTSNGYYSTGVDFVELT